MRSPPPAGVLAERLLTSSPTMRLRFMRREISGLGRVRAGTFPDCAWTWNKQMGAIGVKPEAMEAQAQ